MEKSYKSAENSLKLFWRFYFAARVTGEYKKRQEIKRYKQHDCGFQRLFLGNQSCPEM